MTNTHQEVFIVDGARTPFLKAKGVPNEFSGSDLAVAAGRELINRQTFDASQLDEALHSVFRWSSVFARRRSVLLLRL